MKNNFLSLRRFGRPALLAGLLLLLAASRGWAMNPFRDLRLMPRQEAYVPLSGGTAVTAVQADEGVSAALPLGFDFKFNGASYAQVYAASNGFLSFNPDITAAAASPTNDLNAADPDAAPLLAALWDDLDGSAGTASYRTTGAAGSRVFVFEWRNWQWGRTASGANISFQARLYEGTNRIEYAYTDAGSPAVAGDGASIGVATDSFFASLDGTGPAPALALTTAHNALLAPPATGQVYALLPPPSPANDDCTGAALLAVAPATNRCATAYTGTNRFATPSGSSQANTCVDRRDTWYRFVAPASGAVRVLVSANGTADVEVLSGTCSALTSVFCGGTGNANGNEVPGLTAGNTYYVRVQVPRFGESQPFSVCVSELLAAPALTNDECATALAVPVGSTCAPGTYALAGATPSAGAATPSCERNPVADVWFRFVVPASGTVYAQTSGGAALGGLSSVGLALYSGTCATGFVELGCNVSNGDGQYGRVALTGRTPGEVLYARAWDGFGGNGGSFGLCVSNATVGDLVVDALNSFVQGTYRSVTIAPSGGAELAGTLTVNAALTIADGGSLNIADQQVNGPGTFAVAAGGTLIVKNSAGLYATGASGPVQTAGVRSFSTDANYTFRVEPGAVSGPGLPATVRNLYVNTDVDENFDAGIIPGPGSLTLSGPMAVRQRLHLKRNLVSTSTNLLTLLSTPTQGTALIFNDTDGASINPSPAAVVQGPVRVQRAIDPARNAGAGYRHYASPVGGATVADLATTGFSPVVGSAYNSSATPGSTVPFPTVFGYDESRLSTSPALGGTAFDKGWVAPAAATEPLAVGRGYTVNLGASSLVQLTGPATSGPVSLPLGRGPQAEAGWHFLGNPYPSPLDWSQVSIPADVSGAVYVFESTSQYAGSYRSYINGIGNPIVASGQGFFVRQTGAAGSTAALLLDNAARVTEFADGSSTTFRRPAADRRPLVQLGLRPAGGPLADADPVTVYFETGATSGLDAAFDAAKILNPGLASVFVLAGAERLAISGLAPPTPGTTLALPLGLAVPQAGRYVLSADALRHLAPAGLARVALLDRATGQQTDLTAPGTAYAFALSTTELTSLGRFALVFNPGAAPLATATGLAAQIGLYPNPAHGRFTLSLPALAGTATVQLTLRNALGQPVQPTRTLPLTPTGAIADFDTQALAPGVYLLQVQAAGQPILTRRVVVE